MKKPTPHITKAELLQILQAAIDTAPSLAQWSREHGMSKVYVGDVLSGSSAPGPKILNALGYEKIILYREKS